MLAKPEIMILTNDGELLPDDQPSESLEKKLEIVLPKPFVLWDRPYNDQMGNYRVELYVDRLPDGWHYSVMRYYVNHKDEKTWTRTHNGTYETLAAAKQAGIEMYSALIEKHLIEEKENKEWWDQHGWKVTVIVGICLLILLALAYLWLRPYFVIPGIPR